MCMRERRIYIKDRDSVWFKKQEDMIWTWFILRKQDFTNFTMIDNKMKSFSTDSWFEPSTSTPRDKTLPKCTSFFAWLFNFLLCLLDYLVFPLIPFPQFIALFLYVPPCIQCMWGYKRCMQCMIAIWHTCITCDAC